MTSKDLRPQKGAAESSLLGPDGLPIDHQVESPAHPGDDRINGKLILDHSLPELWNIFKVVLQELLTGGVPLERLALVESIARYAFGLAASNQRKKTGVKVTRVPLALAELKAIGNTLGDDSIPETAGTRLIVGNSTEAIVFGLVDGHIVRALQEVERA